MKPKSIIALILFSVILLSTGCQGVFGPRIKGSGKSVEKTVEVTRFTGVDLAGMGTVNIALGKEPSLKIEAEDNLMEYLEAEVEDGVLRIRIKDNANLEPTQEIRYTVVTDALDSILLSGSGDIIAPSIQDENIKFAVSVSGSGTVETGDLKTRSTKIDLSGSGRIRTAAIEHPAGRLGVSIEGSGRVTVADLDAKSIEGIINGSGKLRVNGGRVTSQNVVINGSGQYIARSVVSKDARVDIPGSGAARVNVKESLGVSIAGSGNVGYIGSPDVSQSIAGSGSVYQMVE